MTPSPLPSNSNMPGKWDLFWATLKSELAKNKKLSVVVIALIIFTGVVAWAQYGDQFIVQINEFFAAECPPDNPNCNFGPDRDQDGWTISAGDCNDNNAAINPGAREICGNSVDEDCDGTAQACSTPTPTPGQCQQDGEACDPAGACNRGICVDSGRGITCVSLCPSGTPTPTATPKPTTTLTQTPTSSPGLGGDDPCAGKSTTTLNGVTYCIRTSNFGGGVCTVNPSGTLFQEIGVRNTVDPMHVVAIGFHNDAKSCSPTIGAPAGVSKSGKLSYQAGESGIFTVSFDSSRFDCGRVQIDSSFRNDRTGNGSIWLGEVVNYDRNCGATTPAPTSTPRITPTPTSTPTHTPTPTLTPTPTPVAISCSPQNQTAAVNQSAVVSAAGGNGTYTWSASSGSPSSGSGSTFGTVFNTAGTYNVSVSSAGQSATCSVTVSQATSGLSCSPSSQSAYIDQTLNFSAAGGTGSYGWSAPGAVYTSGSGQAFSTRYSSTGSRDVTVTSGSSSATCNVSITLAPTPTPPVVGTSSTPSLNITKTVRNISSGSSEADSVNASPNDTIEFIIRVNSNGSSTVRNVRIFDSLPSGMSYVTGTTTVDGVAASDGIISGGLFLGDLAPGRIVTVRFSARIASEGSFSVGTTTLTNTATVSSDNTPTLSDVAFVNVSRALAAGTIQATLAKLGRNISRGEFAEQQSINSSPADTIEFIVRVRSLASSTLTNVILRDVIPVGLAYIPNTTSVNGTAVSDAIVGSSGLNVGSLAPNQEAVVRFSGRVNPSNTLPLGTSTLINTVRTSADGLSELMAQLPVAVLNGQIGGVATVPTGPGESLLVAALVALVITLVYASYTHTELFKRRELKHMMKRERQGEDKFNFKL